MGRLFSKSQIGLILGFILTLVGCRSFYTTPFNEYRPRKPNFRLRPELDDMHVFDSVPFKVTAVYSADLRDITEDYSDWRLVLSSDKRVCSYIDSTEFYDDKLRILPDIWLNAPQVGFYERNADTLVIEFFTPVELGQYIELRGVINDKGDLEIFKQLRGGRGKYKWKEGTQGVDYYRKVDWIQLGF